MPVKILLSLSILFSLCSRAQCPPDLNVSVPFYTLTCFNPTMIATGSSTTSNTQISWSRPFPPYIVNQSSLVIGFFSGGMGFPPYFTYTVTATNTLSSCSSSSIINIYYNFRAPVSLPSISSPGFICNEYVFLNVGNSTVTSGIPGASVSLAGWAGPAPQVPSITNPYAAYVGGTYTLSVIDSQNGCPSAGTVNVSDNRPVFTLSGMAPTTSASCNGSVVVDPASGSNYSFTVNMGSLNGNTITNLCYGNLKVCATDINTGCHRCDSIVMNGATGIYELPDLSGILIYPNPAAHSFYIRIEEEDRSQVKITDLQGLEIRSFMLTKEALVEDVNDGIYIVEIKRSGSVIRKKIIITGI